jgi:hypothetical protein
VTDPSISPEREEAVRRLLASVAAEAPPLPDEVAARLDATLAELTTSRSGSRAGGAVVDLARRRRRRVGALLLAAASVVVALGIAVPLRDTGDHRVTTATDQNADRTTSGQTATGVPDTAAALGAAPSAGTPQLDGVRTEQDAGRRPGAGVPVLHRARLRADLLALRRTLAASTYDSAVLRAPAGFTCADARFGRGRLVAVRYAGAPAVAAFRSPTASTQVAEVLQCGTAAVLGSVTLPPPR